MHSRHSSRLSLRSILSFLTNQPDRINQPGRKKIRWIDRLTGHQKNGSAMICHIGIK